MLKTPLAAHYYGSIWFPVTTTPLMYLPNSPKISLNSRQSPVCCAAAHLICTRARRCSRSSRLFKVRHARTGVGGGFVICPPRMTTSSLNYSISGPASGWLVGALGRQQVAISPPSPSRAAEGVYSSGSGADIPGPGVLRRFFPPTTVMLCGCIKGTFEVPFTAQRRCTPEMRSGLVCRVTYTGTSAQGRYTCCFGKRAAFFFPLDGSEKE